MRACDDVRFTHILSSSCAMHTLAETNLLSSTYYLTDRTNQITYASKHTHRYLLPNLAPDDSSQATTQLCCCQNLFDAAALIFSPSPHINTAPVSSFLPHHHPTQHQNQPSKSNSRAWLASCLKSPVISV
jgi:hypothetical protein